jgi:cytochrome bd-type quinol oxidase subunit 2
MSLRSNLPGYRRLQFLRNAAIRTGVYTGICLSLVFVTWLVIANQVPLLERFALERNIAAAAVLGFLAAVPVLRFFRVPGNLLASSLIGWMIFSLVYRILCMIYHALSDWHSTFQVFMEGAVVYMILTTLSWIGTIIRRVRAAHVSHPNHRVS